jgi:hypothetical protein
VIALKARTRQSGIEIAAAARTRVYRGADELEVTRETYQSEDYIHQAVSLELLEGVTVRVEKLAALYSSRDRGISEPLEAAIKSAGRYPTSTRRSTARRTRGTSSGTFRVRSVCSSCCASHAAHLLQVSSRQTAHHDAGIPRPRPQRRGVSRPRLLGRALRVPVPELPPAADRAVVGGRPGGRICCEICLIEIS